MCRFDASKQEFIWALPPVRLIPAVALGALVLGVEEINARALLLVTFCSFVVVSFVERSERRPHQRAVQEEALRLHEDAQDVLRRRLRGRGAEEHVVVALASPPALPRQRPPAGRLRGVRPSNAEAYKRRLEPPEQPTKAWLSSAVSEFLPVMPPLPPLWAAAKGSERRRSFAGGGTASRRGSAGRGVCRTSIKGALTRDSAPIHGSDRRSFTLASLASSNCSTVSFQGKGLPGVGGCGVGTGANDDLNLTFDGFKCAAGSSSGANSGSGGGSSCGKTLETAFESRSKPLGLDSSWAQGVQRRHNLNRLAKKAVWWKRGPRGSEGRRRIRNWAFGMGALPEDPEERSAASPEGSGVQL